MERKINYLKERIEGNSESILIFLLIIFFLSEAISKISVLSHAENFGIQPGIKSIVLVLILMGLVLYRKKELVYIFVLTAIFCIGQLTISEGFQLHVVPYFLKYIFPIAFLGFFTVQEHNPKLKLLSFFEYILIFNSALVLIGFVFEIHFFRSYTGARFGYNGLLMASSTGTYFYIIGLCYFLARYQKKVIVNWRFWLIVLAGLLVGTKAIALATTAIFSFYIIKFVYSKTVKWVLIALVVSVAISFAYYLFFINPIFRSLWETDGLLTSFLSFRDQLFMEKTLPYMQQNWGFWNYLFGGISNFEIRPQMALFDTIFFWGLIGSFCYAYFYSKSLLQFKIKNSPGQFILMLLLVIALLAGNFFYNASVVIYVVILRECLMLTAREAYENKSNSK